jgi:PH/SEC7 domain-containing protein
MGANPFLQMPDPQTAKEFKFGWLLRKCCVDSDGKRVPFLKRSWKMFYASLRDMVLYLHKDDKVFQNSTFNNITNAIRIHHAYATVASDYKKKQFVFRLKTADWSEYLFQTSNSNELYDWVGSINLVAAIFSSPPLPSGIGSAKSFQRPLLPVSKTRYTLQEQFEYHKKHIKQLQSDFVKLESAAGALNNNYIKNDEKFFDKDKYNYLQFEIQRYTIYVNKLEEQILQDTTTLNLQPPQIAQLTMINPSFVLNDPTTTTTTAITETSTCAPPPPPPIYLNNNNNNNNNTPSITSSHQETMRTATTPLSSSPLKSSNLNQNNLHVNFNISPTMTTITTTTTTTNGTANTMDSQLSHSPNTLKFNNYLD